MKTLLKLLYFLLTLLIILLLSGIFLPKETHIESSTTIGASMEIVFDQVNDFRNWENWSPWFEADTAMVFVYNDQTAGTGASYKWTSEKSGSGNQTMKESIPGQSIHTYIDFGEQGDANGSWEFEEGEKNIKVTWAFDDSDLGYFERYFMILFKNKIQSDLKKGLQNLKNVSEELRLSRVSGVKILTLELQPAMAVVDSSDVDGMAAKMAEMFDKLNKYLEKRDLVQTGAPFTMYYTWNPEGLTKFACGVPIEKRTWGWKQYIYLELSEGQVALITHWGRYGSEKPWLVLDQYLKENKLQISGAPWEVYLTDPSSEPDTSQWKLEVYYPVSK